MSKKNKRVETEFKEGDRIRVKADAFPGKVAPELEGYRNRVGTIAAITLGDIPPSNPVKHYQCDFGEYQIELFNDEIELIKDE